jgi:hypothetical protein
VQYFRDLATMIGSGVRPGPDDFAGLMARYATEPSSSYAEDA